LNDAKQTFDGRTIGAQRDDSKRKEGGSSGTEQRRSGTLSLHLDTPDTSYDLEEVTSHESDSCDEETSHESHSYDEETSYKGDTSYEEENSFEPDTSCQQDVSYESDCSCQQDVSYESDTSGQQDVSYESDTSGQQDVSYESDTSGQQDVSYESDTSCQQDVNYASKELNRSYNPDEEDDANSEDSGYASVPENLVPDEVLDILSDAIKGWVTIEDVGDMWQKAQVGVCAPVKVGIEEHRYIFSVFGCHLCGEKMNDFASVQIHLKSCSAVGIVKCNLGEICSQELVHFHYIGCSQEYVCNKCNLIVDKRKLRQHKDNH